RPPRTTSVRASHPRPPLVRRWPRYPRVLRPAPAPPMSDLLAALLLGILEGLTEFLPVSSTGHLLIAQHFIGEQRPDLFNIVIQAGAILATTLVFRHRLWALATGLRGAGAAGRAVGGGGAAAGAAAAGRGGGRGRGAGRWRAGGPGRPRGARAGGRGGGAGGGAGRGGGGGLRRAGGG